MMSLAWKVQNRQNYRDRRLVIAQGWGNKGIEVLEQGFFLE